MEKTKDIQIIQLLESRTIMSVTELSESLECSEMTIRRYLDDLQERGLVQRMHGGAYLCQNAKPTKFDEQANIHTREKYLIALEASKMIKSGDIVCFDSGTTIHRMMRLIDNQMSFTAITPSIPLMMDLGKYNQVDVRIPEGELNHNNLTIQLSSNALMQKVDADISFISSRSLWLPNGTYEHTDDLIPTKRWLAKQAKKCCLLVDSSKWQRRSVQSCVPLKDIDVIITDSAAPNDQISLAKSLGKEVLIVSD